MSLGGPVTRRELLQIAASAAVPARPQARVTVPLHRVVDSRANLTAAQLQGFWSRIWPEAYREFSLGGIQLETTDGPGEIRRLPSDRPLFVGLRRGAINLVLTDHIPMDWDSGRAVAGVSTVLDGYHMSVLALRYAHGNQIPFFSVNTCVHEFLHLLMQDVFLRRPKWYETGARESRIDWYATRLWLFHEGAAIRTSAQVYLKRMKDDLKTHMV